MVELMKTVVVLGAGPQPGRYAFMAMKRLQEHGYKAVPVNPSFTEVLGEKCHPNITGVPQPIDTSMIFKSRLRQLHITREILFQPLGT